MQAAIEGELDERVIQAALFPAEQLQALPIDDRFARREALRRPGRPIGSPNKRSIRMRDWAQAKGYLDPLLFFAEGISRSPQDLALELGCSVYEAAKLQGDWADRLAPYWHSKMPVAVLHAGALPMIELVDPAKAAALYADVESEQIQSLIDVVEPGVAQPELHDAAIVEADQGDGAPLPVIADHTPQAGRP